MAHSTIEAAKQRSRARKLELLTRYLLPLASETLLDVGASNKSYAPSDNYLEQHYPWPSRITALGLPPMDEFRARYPDVTVVEGDGRRMPFDPDQFDLVHSNAVVEHVGGPEDQRRFVSECVRVGRRGMLTTPNRWFPIELHTRLPFVHYLDYRAFDWCARLVGKPWAQHSRGYITFVSPRALRVWALESGAQDATVLGLGAVIPVQWLLFWAKDGALRGRH